MGRGFVTCKDSDWLFHGLDPAEQVVHIVVAGMGTVPGQREVDVETSVTQTGGKVQRNQERGVTILGTVSNVPMASHSVIVLANEVPLR